MKHIAKTILASCFVVVGIHIWGALQPSHSNWGAHFYAFLDPVVLWVVVILTLMMCIPAIQAPVVRFLNKILESFGKLPTLAIFGLVALIVILCGRAFAAQLHLLGDGALLLRSLSNTDWGSNIMQSFNNQPLMYGIFRSALNLHLIGSPDDTYDLYILIDRLASVLFLLTLFWFLANSKLTQLEK